MDSDSPYSITFGQTLWKIGISSVGTTIDEKNPIQNFEKPTPDLDSPYSITFGQTLWKKRVFQTIIENVFLTPNGRTNVRTNFNYSSA